VPDPDGYVSAVQLLLDRLGPDRLMWGSDWPHTQHEATATLFDGLRLLTRAVPEADTLERILVRTPQSFFDF
jgi:predicted TIM-barrel fold metal-dependent hydrolase